jgi:hypothetical protein
VQESDIDARGPFGTTGPGFAARGAGSAGHASSFGLIAFDLMPAG